MKPDTYILDGIEVKKTGRTAKKEMPTMPGGRKAPGLVPTLVEVTPISESDGSWLKWVSEGTLFKVVTGD